MKNVLFVFGTRPEAIKIAPLIKEFQKWQDKFSVKICVTGQHREMLDQVLKLFGIVPDFDLKIMSPGQDLFDITSKVLIGMKDILDLTIPDLVFVHGDTSTSTSAALAAFYRQIQVGHIEAGLRTNNILSPWPEEMNRQLTSRIATYHFAPTQLSRTNLLRENIDDKNIIVTGNTVIDALQLVTVEISTNKKLEGTIVSMLKDYGYDITGLDKGRKMILITGHRRENFGEGFMRICQSIKALSQKYQNFDFVYPMHLNPNVREPISKVFKDNIADNVYFIEPVEYLQFVYLMNRSYLVLTDSGGIQEEAPGLGKPVLVMRDTTERPEAIDAGTALLVGTDFDKILGSVSKLIEDSSMYTKMSEAVNPYGDGKASERIVKWLLWKYNI